MLIILALILQFISTCASFAADLSVALQGRLVEKGTRNPLEGVNVFVLPSRKKAMTDARGRFTIEGVPEGKITWVVNAPGYQRLEQGDVARAGEETQDHTLYLERDTYQVYETTIYGQAQKRDNSMRVLKREEILKMPGSLGDPVRATQNLPGVNRPAALSSQVVIQGSGPRDTEYLLNGHEVPLVFHFGGLTSIMIPEATDRVELFQAGYGPEWGRATAGLVGLWGRTPRTDRLHGLAFGDLLNAGALLEGPVGEKSGFLLSVRRSYIGEVLRAAFKNNDDFNLTVAPAYSDATAIFATELTPKDKLTLTAFGSQDQLEFLLKEPLKQDPIIRGTLDSGTSFFRVIPQYTHTHSSSTTSRLSLGVGKDWVHVINNDTYFQLQNLQLSARGEVEHRFNSVWLTQLGFDNIYRWSHVNVSVPDYFVQGGVGNPLSTGTVRRTTTSDRAAFTALYSRNEVSVPSTRLTLLPNARLERYSSTHETLFSPRPAMRYQLDNSLILRGSGGLYYQPPEPQELDATFGNPNLRSPRAWHADLGVDKDFRQGTGRGWTVTADAFYKKLERLVIPSSALINTGTGFVPESYNNNGSGNIIGAQTQIKLDQNPWTFQAIYTLSRSRRSEPGHDDYPARYDQTHLVGLIGAVQLPRNWVISGRFRYATGNPTTPIAGSIYDSDNDVYIPVRGPFFSERVPAFYQADLRFDKKWIFDKWILSLYLDIQNVTNRKNVEGQIYSYDYSKTEYLTGLPILPLLGLKGEF